MDTDLVFYLLFIYLQHKNIRVYSLSITEYNINHLSRVQEGFAFRSVIKTRSWEDYIFFTFIIVPTESKTMGERGHEKAEEYLKWMQMIMDMRI